MSGKELLTEYLVRCMKDMDRRMDDRLPESPEEQQMKDLDELAEREFTHMLMVSTSQKELGRIRSTRTELRKAFSVNCQHPRKFMEAEPWCHRDYGHCPLCGTVTRLDGGKLEEELDCKVHGLHFDTNSDGSVTVIVEK